MAQEPALKPSRYAKLAGAHAQFRRARLLELRITYDLAFDRVVHHGRLVEFNGSSRRMGESLMLGKGKEDQMGETMMTLGELKSAIAGLDDDLLLSFPVSILGKTVHCGVSSVSRVEDPCLGFDEAVFEMSFDPDLVAGDESLMAELWERRKLLEIYYESICE